MQEMLENQIRERAYHIWMANGCVDGEADRHWLTAEQEVTAAVAQGAPKPARRRAAKKR
jgi:hypothetical protein